jgi:predicted phage terminase large subunit-like protein
MPKNKQGTDNLFEQLLSDRQIRKETVRSKLEYFFPIYFHHYMEFETAPFHEEMYHILEDEKILFAVFTAFRGSAKSSIITTAYVLWSILGYQQKKFIIIGALTEQKARQCLINIKNELLHNILLKNDLGPFTEEKNSLGNATAIIIKKLNVKIMICSVEQSVRGVRHGEHRPDLIILDDIEDINSVKTQDGRNKTYNWLTGEVLPAGGTKTRFIVVGNLLHEDSVLKRLQRKIMNGEMSTLNAVYREYPIINDEGLILWPGKYPTLESIEQERQKTADEVAWHREYLLKIISSADQVVRPEWIHTYSTLPENDLRKIVFGIDLAISQRDSADYTAIVVAYVYGYGNDTNIYILPQPANLKITYPEQVSYIKSLYGVHRHMLWNVEVFIEDVGYQRALVQSLETDGLNVRGVGTGGLSKMERLKLTTAFLQNGKVLFPKIGCEDLITQMIGFGKETHDDLADAFSLLTLQVFQEPAGLAVISSGNPRPI